MAKILFLNRVFGSETEATGVLSAVNKSNAGILVDTLHFDRSNSSIEELKRLPREWFRFAHVSDAPKEKPMPRP